MHLQVRAHVDVATQMLTHLAFASVADWAIVPMQDALDLGLAGRMNIPGLAEDNWGWRMRPEQAELSSLEWLTALARTYGRMPRPVEDTDEDDLY